MALALANNDIASLLDGADSERILREIELQEIREECAADLLAFMRRFWRLNDPNTPFVEGWPLEAICDHLMAVSDGDIKRLIINVPPGSTKSTAVSVMFPAFEWGPCAKPWLRYICAAYSGHLTLRDNRRFRRVVSDAEYQALWGHLVVLDGKGQKVVSNEATGFKLATSLRGVGTGERGNRVIIDDPNNPKDVESEVVREGTNIWMTEVMPDRLNALAKDSIILVQQRTHQSDATGTLLDRAGLDYTHLVIPAEYDPQRHCVTVLKWTVDEPSGERYAARTWEDPRGLDDDGEQLPGRLDNGYVVSGSPIALREGELFWPARIPRSQIQEQKTAKGPFAFSGQYQQSPVPRGGGILLAEWWRVWKEEDYPEFVFVLGSLDTAFKEEEENDYNALTIMGIFIGDNGHLQIMLRWAWAMRGTLSEIAGRVGKDCLRFGVDTLLIEDKSRGHDTAIELKKEFGSRDWNTILVEPQGDKVSRANSVVPTLAGDAVEDLVFTEGDPNCDHALSGPTRKVTDRCVRCGAMLLRVGTVWKGGIVWAPDKDWAQEVIDQCIIAGTMIITKRGVIPVEQVAPGDEVLTHMGRFRPVLCVASRDAAATVTIEGKSLDVLTLTPEHPVYTALVARDRSAIGPMMWKPAGELQARTYADRDRGGVVYSEAMPSPCHAMVLPIVRRENPQNELDLREWAMLPHGNRLQLVETGDLLATSHHAIKAIRWRQPLDRQFGRAMGLYLAEGSSRRAQTTWSLGSHETVLIEEICAFGERIGVRVNVDHRGSCTTVSINVPLLESLFADCGRHAHNKRVPSWAWDAPDECIRGLIDGYADGDGWKDEANGFTACTTVSPSLVWGMRLLGLMIGRRMTSSVARDAGSTTIGGRKVPTKRAYHIRWFDEPERNGATIMIPEAALYSIMRVSSSGPQKVYNLHVAEDASYCTTGGVVHNCAIFPRGKHDDLVDAVTQALNYLRKQNLALREAEFLDAKAALRKRKPPVKAAYDV